MLKRLGTHTVDVHAIDGDAPEFPGCTECWTLGQMHKSDPYGLVIEWSFENASLEPTERFYVSVTSYGKFPLSRY